MSKCEKDKRAAMNDLTDFPPKNNNNTIISVPYKKNLYVKRNNFPHE